MALKKLTGLWLNESKQGQKYLKGKDEEGNVYLIFKNDKQGNDKAPDYNLFIEVQEEEKGLPTDNYEPEEVGDDVPF